MTARRVHMRQGVLCSDVASHHARRGAGMLVSVVLPTFNGAKYLAGAINSVIRQTYSNWELIVVDDGSTDDTSRLAAVFSQTDDRVKIHHNTRNLGLPISLNVGMKSSSGQLLTWTSDDNICRPHALQTMVECFSGSPDVAFVYADYTVVDDQGQYLRCVKVDEISGLMRGNCIGPCFMYRRQVHELVGDYDPCARLAEDYDYWLRVSKVFRMMPLHQDLYLYRAHRSSLTELHRNEARIVVTRALAKHAIDLPWATPEERAECYLRLTRHARERGSNVDAIRCLSGAVHAAPGLCFSRFLRWLRRLVATFFSIGTIGDN